jgi:hypothetical protein
VTSSKSTTYMIYPYLFKFETRTRSRGASFFVGSGSLPILLGLYPIFVPSFHVAQRMWCCGEGRGCAQLRHTPPAVALEEHHIGGTGYVCSTKHPNVHCHFPAWPWRHRLGVSVGCLHCCLVSALCSQFQAVSMNCAVLHSSCLYRVRWLGRRCGGLPGTPTAEDKVHIANLSSTAGYSERRHVHAGLVRHRGPQHPRPRAV